MRLSTRLTLLILGFGLLVTLALVMIGRERERQNRYGFETAILHDRQVVWNKVLEILHRRMEETLDVVRLDASLAGALATGRLERVRWRMPELTDRLRAMSPVERVEVYDLDGGLVFTSAAGLFPQAMIATERVAEVIGDGVVLRGIGNESARTIMLAVVFPLTRADRVVGAAAVGIPIDVALHEMEDATSSRVLVVNRRGRLLATTSDFFWQRLIATGTFDPTRDRQSVHLNDRHYRVVRLPLRADLGTLIAHLMIVRDVTPLMAEEQMTTQSSVFVVVGLILLAFLTLALHVRRSLAPLASAAVTLDALAHERTDVTVHGLRRSDEIGSIATAIDRLRRNLLGFQSMRQARQRQGARQRRFIHHHLTRLAESLDGEARADLLRRLSNLEAAARTDTGETATPAPPSDGPRFNGPPFERKAPPRAGFALLAQAFGVLTEQIGTLQERLNAARNRAEMLQRHGKALADDALRTRNALLAALPAPTVLPEPPGGWVGGRSLPGDVLPRCLFAYAWRTGECLDMVVVSSDTGGLAGAIRLASFQAMLQALSRDSDPFGLSPSERLARLNDELAALPGVPPALGAVWGTLSLVDGRFRCAHAGAAAAWLVPEAVPVPVIDTPAPPLGRNAGIRFPEHEVAIPAGSGLLLITDGVIGGCDRDGHPFGTGRLMDCLRQADVAAPEDLLDGVIGAVARHVDDRRGSLDLACLYAYLPGPFPQGSDETDGADTNNPASA